MMGFYPLLLVVLVTEAWPSYSGILERTGSDGGIFFLKTRVKPS